jgi:endonuclease/exonuclease/phosphatase (EEP) superfamily protein YafD
MTAPVAAVGFTTSGLLIASEFLRSAGPRLPPGSQGEIKIVQFNVWSENRRLAEVTSWLQRENPDFVMIEEATPALRNRMVFQMGWHVAGAATTAMIFSRAPYLGMRRPNLGSGSRLT